MLEVKVVMKYVEVEKEGKPEMRLSPTSAALKSRAFQSKFSLYTLK